MLLLPQTTLGCALTPYKYSVVLLKEKSKQYIFYWRRIHCYGKMFLSMLLNVILSVVPRCFSRTIVCLKIWEGWTREHMFGESLSVTAHSMVWV